WIMRVKQHVLRQDAGLRQPVKQRGFAGIRVADEHDSRQPGTGPRSPLQPARAANVLQPALQLEDAFSDDAAIELDLRFTRATGFAEAAALTFQVRPRSHQPRAFVALPRELDLQFAFLGARTKAEDFEDQSGPVDDLGADIGFQIALLHRR